MMVSVATSYTTTPPSPGEEAPNGQVPKASKHEGKEAAFSVRAETPLQGGGTGSYLPSETS